MDALVSERQPDSAQLDHLRVETRLVGVDETDPVQELLQHLGPAGQREEQVVVGVRLFEPHHCAFKTNGFCALQVHFTPPAPVIGDKLRIAAASTLAL